MGFLRTVAMGLCVSVCALAATEVQIEPPKPKPRTYTKGINDGLFYVNFGVGFPSLGALEFTLAPFKKWHFGASYGLIPGGGSGGSISPKYTFPNQNVTLSSGAHVTVYEPTITATFASICPYVRFYPGTTGFYMQMTFAMLRINNELSSKIYDVMGREIPGASYGGSVLVTQYLPTISIGHIFIQKFFFFSVNMGVSIVANVTSSPNLTAQLPDALGGSEANQDAIDELNSRNQEFINQGSQEFRRQVAMFPSLQLLFGINF